MPDRDSSLELLHNYVESDSLRHHCRMVAEAMEEYAQKLGKETEAVEEWWTTGLLHDLDWELYPDTHPKTAVEKILPEHGYSKEVIGAVESHAPGRTGREPETKMERYLFACDELSGFMYAVSLMRPNGFSDMKVKSVTKKLKDKKFAENVSREDISKGADLVDSDLKTHIQQMIEIFRS